MNSNNQDTFVLRGKDSEATGELTEDGFLVREGAVARQEIVPSAIEYVTPVRTELLADGILVEDGQQLRFTKDHVFSSPSRAAAIVLGRTSNGWIDWKHEDGRTLSQVKRVSRVSGEVMLTDSKRKAILAKHEELLNVGRIYTQKQLDGYFAIFRERFGPSALSALDGEALLELIHDHGNRDSLVYWLEFKSDHEFDTKRFGSIAGGSALKFRVFRRRETGNWQAGGASNKPKDISIDEAVEFARAHRDQLLKGVQLLEELPENATDDDYAQLQDDMDELAPDVSKLAWGHKYFSLLFPDKIDDYHSPDWQRFHILKLQQLPPEGNGRYICAGRFVSATKEVNLPIHHFTATLNAVQGRLHRYWRVGTRGGTDKVSHWPMMQERDCIAIGWKALGDLSWVEAKKDKRQELKLELEKVYPDQDARAIGNDCSQITHFVAGLNEGDIVLAADGATVLGIGRIAGEYKFEPEFEFPHQRPVEWLSFDEWKMPNPEGLRSTVREVRKHAENIVEAEKRIQSGDPVEKPERQDATIKRHVRLKGILGRIQSVLDRKAQVILYGPPGTGKTYWAEHAANELAAIASFGRRFQDLDDQERQSVKGTKDSAGTVRMCCFHPAYLSLIHI